MTHQEAAQFLTEHDNYLILTHKRPDGDTIGCGVGLCHLLRKMGKTAWLLPSLDATALFREYLEGVEAPEGYTPDTVVSVDVATLGLLPQNAQPYVERIDLAIDHHPSQEFFAKNTCLEADKAACGEILWEIAQDLGVMNETIATPLYVAVSTDCGCFVYSNTTPGTHRVAAALMETGFDAFPVNRRFFRTKSFKRLKLEGMLTEGMELRDGGSTALVFLTIAMVDALQATEEDMDDISAFVGQIEGVRTGATLKETRDGNVKISLRTDPDDLNASSVCALLGGGGHAAASGAMLRGVTMAQARQALVDAMEKVRHG